MTDQLTNEAALLTAVNIVRRLPDKVDAADDADMLNMIFEQVKAGMIVHHFLAQEPKSEPAPSLRPSCN